MAQLQIASLPRAGTQERGPRLCQEVAALRTEQFAAVCQQAGITRVQISLLPLLLTSEDEGDDEWIETEKTARHTSEPPAMA
jgi:hypothetical protein